LKKNFISAVLAMAVVFSIATAGLVAKNDDYRFEFQRDSIVLTRTVFTQPSITVGEALPLSCIGGATLSYNVTIPTTTSGVNDVVAVSCGDAVDDGEFPNLNNTHSVWNNSISNTTKLTKPFPPTNPAGVITTGDPLFGVSSQIFLDNLSHDGDLLGTLPIPTNLMVTSFSSKSELALNRSTDGKSLTFMGYQGGVGCGGTAVSRTAAGLLDVSASNTPGVCDPTNPVITSIVSNPVVPTAYYRAVAEVDADGHLAITDGNAFSGDNGRAAFKGANGLYYMVGNDNNGNLSKSQLPLTPDGINLSNDTGAELLTPGATPPTPPNVAMIGRLNLISGDKAGKEDNFRGLTIFNNTMYVTKGSGSNGVNTVYQVGTVGTLPTGTAATLATVPITILPGFPNTAASVNTAFPFGIWFANANTLYVCDEGDGVLATAHTVNGVPNVADTQSLATAGLQKWVFNGTTWMMLYVIQDGLDIGVQYNVKNYPTTISPATGGCRNIVGRHNGDGTVTIYAVTSTISTNGDTGADPNKLVKVRDRISDTTLPVTNGDYGRYDRLGFFTTIRSAKAGEAFRGVALAPHDDDRDNHDRDHDRGHGDGGYGFGDHR
jgi:hypothetical protein